MSSRPSAALASGQRLDRYELLCPIAEGGMGVCWLARIQGKHGFEKLVALKLMKTEYASDPEFRRMFLDEARIASGIEHGNVAQILDLGEHEGVLFLVMEYVDGDSLHKLRRTVTEKSVDIPIGIGMRILADTLGGLHAAHQLADSTGAPLGVVHRDVSPQNILVSMKGAAKLIDFGIAKARERTAGETSTGTVKGKLHFMAPEQALNGTVDARTDVFSIGAVLYYLVAKRYAYAGETQAATILSLVSGARPAPLPETIPAPIVAIVTKALAFERSDRFASAAEMQDALEDAMVKTGNATTTTTVARFVGEHLAERAQARKKAIELATDALARGVPYEAGPPSLSGLDSSSDGRLARSLPQKTKLGIGPSPAHGDPQIPVTDATDLPGALNAESGSFTVGGALMHEEPSPAPRRKLGRIALVVAAALGVVGIVLIATVTLRTREPARAGSSSSESPAHAALSIASAPLPLPSASAPPPETAANAPTESAPPAQDAPATTSTASRVTQPAAQRPRPAPAPTTYAPKKKRRNLDDGF